LDIATSKPNLYQRISRSYSQVHTWPKLSCGKFDAVMKALRFRPGEDASKTKIKDELAEQISARPFS